MPCSLRGTSNSSERTNRIQSNRSVGQNIDSCFSKDQQVRKAVSNNPERYIIFTLLSLEHDSYWKLAPFLPAIQEANKRNRLTSGAPSGTESLESLSAQPTIEYWLDQRNEKNINMHDQTDSVKRVSYGSSLGGSVLRQPRNGKKINNSSTAFLPCYVVSDKSSRSVTGSPAAGSDFLVDDLTKADKTTKRSPRKKGKKKRKQYRRATCKKINSVSEIPCEENIDAASPLEIPHNNLLVSKLAETSSSTSSSVKEVSLDKDDSENNNEYVDCPTVLISSTSGSDWMDDSEPTASSRETICEGFSCNGVACLNDGSNAAEASEVNRSAFGDKHGYAFSREESNSCHRSSCASVCNSNTATIDSFLDGWNSDISGNYSDDLEAKLTVKDQSRCDPLQCGVSTDLSNLEEASHSRSARLSNTRAEGSNDSFVSSSCCSKDITDSRNSIERVKCSSEACSSNGFLPVFTGRRGRRSRKTSSYGNLNGSNRVISANNHNRSGKDSSVSVWQKVQKLNNKESISRAGHVSAAPLQDKPEDTKKGIKPDPSRRVKQNQSRKACKQACSDEAVKAESTEVENDAFNSRGMFSKSIYKKQTSVANQKSTSSSKQATPQSSKNYYTAKNNLCKVPKNHSQQKGGLPTLQLVNAKHTKSGLLSSSVTSHELLITPTEGVSNNITQENGGSQADIDKATPGICNMGSDLVPETASEEAGLSSIQQDPHCHLSIESKPISISSGGSTNLSRDLYCAEMEDNQCIELEIENSPQEPSELDSGAGHVLQKWVPVGKKEISDMFHLDGSKASGIQTSVPDNDNSNYAKIEVSGNISDVLASTGGRLSSCPVSQYVDHSCLEDGKSEREGKTEPYLSGEFDGLNCKAPTKAETDLDKISKAVSDAYKAQKTVEDIQFVNGGPLADFERLMYSASPVVDCNPCPKSWYSCSQQWTGDDLCKYQIPNICLKSIWQWYEEPGCYGLEVKARDFCKSKGLWNSNYEFTAYFVPYLSAVQLFGQPKNTRPGCSTEEAAEMDRTSKPSSHLSSIPILSKLLPRPSNQRNSSSYFSTKDDQLLGKEDGELIFEYFESEQPPWRRPLFEKIKELVGGVKPSNCRISGDPKYLECLSLHDLHPASWYCVAWYPIYRIPDGKFHAAFLTYHSLGHLVHRSSSSDPAHVVSPVVGLQSYNDKGERWFQMSSSYSDSGALMESSFCSSPSQVLRERLRTLNQTASVMARASFSKGGQTCRNTHPDYEFFLSRYR